MKKVPLPRKMASHLFPSGFRYATMLALTMTVTSCDKSVLQEAASSTSGALARLAGEPLFSSSYELETYSISKVLSREGNVSKADVTFAEILHNHVSTGRRSVSNCLPTEVTK